MDLIKTFGIVSGLASINRFSMVRLSRPESVLEHTGQVAIFCYLIRNQIYLKLGIDLSLGELLSKAIVHDWDELITGDISRPTKYANNEIRAEFFRLERAGIKKISQFLDDKFLVDFHDQAKLDETGWVVSVADLACVVYKIWDEVLLQNNFLMVRQAINVQEYLKTRKESFLKINNSLARFLAQLIEQMETIAAEAAAYDRPIHGCLREEIFNGN